MKWLSLIALLAACGCPARPAAQPADVHYQKTKVYTFDDDTIEGDLVRPDGEYLEARHDPAAACQAGNVRGCAMAAEELALTEPARAAPFHQRALELGTAACDKGDPVACQVLSDLARHDQDPDRAAQYHQRACQLAPDRCSAIKTGIEMEE